MAEFVEPVGVSTLRRAQRKKLDHREPASP